MKAYIVERDRLKQNIDVIKKRAAGKAIYGVIKGNGYGLGLLQLTRILRDEGIDRFAVTEPKDALRMRAAGYIDEDILVMRSVVTQDDLGDIIASKCTATVGSYEDAILLNDYAEQHQEIVEAHIKIDIGMGRYGFRPSETDRVLSVFRTMKNIHITGIYTHFPCAFCDRKKTELQYHTFLAVVQTLREAGCDPGCVHAANSAFLFRHDFAETDAVRVGSAILGRLSFRLKNNGGLLPVGYARCEVAQVRMLQAGQTTGYGSAYTAKKDIRTAVIPVGYADGFHVARGDDIFRFRDKLRYIYHSIKSLAQKKCLYVTINGRKAPVLGHIGMLHVVVDVTGIKCEAGDIARLDINPLFANPNMERVYE